MCGIAGMVARRGVEEETLARMQQALLHRGPDDRGLWCEGEVGLASTRLAILDVSPRGHMPMVSADGRFVIVYNGEIYNFLELRAALQRAGHALRTTSDTEVLLELWAREGERVLPRLNGMFALAVWDRIEHRLVLARDHLGVKPLAYRERDGILHFASEEKALFAAGLLCEFDPGVWAELLCFRFVAGESTVFRGVKRLPPGHLLRWQNDRIETRCWWSLHDRVAELRDTGPERTMEWYREVFDDAVARQRVSDVPVGVLLSGGLDSGSIASSLALQEPKRLESFTVRFAEPAYDEGPLAAEVARRWGFAANELVLGPETLLQGIEEASWFNDEPLAHGNDHCILAIARLAKPKVTVLLSGEGGDETLGGYVRYFPLRFPFLLGSLAAAPSLAGLAGSRGRKLGRMLTQGGVRGSVLFNAADVVPVNLAALGLVVREGAFAARERRLEEGETLYPREPVRQAMHLDLATFLGSILQRTDRMTMGASIECRVPFLDIRLVEGLAALPTKTLLRGWQSKPLLRRTLGSRLPPNLLKARKWGFGVPWHIYLRTVPELRALLDRIEREEPVASSPISSAGLRRLVKGFLSGDDRPLMLLRQLVLVVVWHRVYMRRLRSVASWRTGLQ